MRAVELKESRDVTHTKVSVVLPAYNEEKRIGARLQNLDIYFDKVMGKDFELLVVIDGCTDNTPQIVSQYMSCNNNIAVIHFPNRLGKGGALIEAFKFTKGDVVLLTDADDSTSPSELFKLIKATEDCDLAIGSRYVRGSRLPVEEPFMRFFLGRSFNAIVKLMFWKLKKINDTQCGAKAIRKNILERIREALFITGFAMDVNLIYSTMRGGFKVKEVGITWEHMEYESKVSTALIKLVLGMFFSLIRLRLYYSRFCPVLNTIAMTSLSTFLWNLTKA